jgi:hypothetical protein
MRVNKNENARLAATVVDYNFTAAALLLGVR